MDVSNPIPGGGSLAFSQLGADGKIYIAGPGNHYYLSRINRPNCPGTACDFQQWEIVLLAPNYGGLPNMPHYNIIESDYGCENVSTYEGQVQKEALRVFPNPFTNVLQLSYDFQKPVQYTLFNAIGQKMDWGTLRTSETLINVRDNLFSGIYFLNIWSDKERWNMKVIKTEMR
jgi:Secretion system C-terminal sorting domain